MKERKVDVKDRYDREIEEIDYILRNLEQGRIYDITRTPGEPYLQTAVSKIREKLNDLINKIEYDKDSIDEKLGEALFNTKRD
ncbi:hypothetical protein [Priestia megaterium]|uniref:hypothetical protein n=1 Tax=Priestia megaterium TaxID=1404 RepID=UPI002E1C0387|nr:hypothetical protein [Priestia megaterium]MED4278266.1 hypothetical protein [Priestia megaterium]MED4314371.1 hypothetical protein [Priestia megaterium]